MIYRMGPTEIEAMRKNLPPHMHSGLQKYLELGLHPGSFLMAILTNNFVNAFAKANNINQQHMMKWAQFMVWDMPSESWGSEEKVNAWMKKVRTGLRSEENLTSA